MTDENAMYQRGKCQLTLKLPETDQYREWLASQSDTYAAAIGYVSFFIEQRAQMGDMSSAEVLAEFEKNVNRFLVGGYDVLGTQ